MSWWDDGGARDVAYTGAPDECSPCFVRGAIVRLVDGKCPECVPLPEWTEEELWFGPMNEPFRFQGETG